MDLNQLLRWVLENLHGLIGESGASVTTDALPVISADEGQLGQVLQNLLGNAIKYRRPGVPPIVRITAEKNESEWTIRVSDNGIGIDKEYQEAIFAPFKRLHAGNVRGSGIGLAVCRRVVEAHGGRIWVESTPGEGSTFSFTLPDACC